MKSLQSCLTSCENWGKDSCETGYLWHDDRTITTTVRKRQTVYNGNTKHGYHGVY